MAEKKFDPEKIIMDGCLISPFDGRDYDFRCATGIKSAKDQEYPTEFMISNTSKVYSQGSTSMCVAFSLAEIKESQELLDQQQRIRFSPGFIYANRDETKEGMYIREGLKNLKADGVVTYDDFPVKGTCSHCQKKLAECKNLQEMFANAKGWRIGSYYRVYTLEEIKYTLMNIGPIIISVPCYTGWNYFSGKIVQAGKLRGYHAMVIVGWKNNDEIIVQNSWGTAWGNKGLGTFKWDEYPVVEAWAVTDYEYDQNVKRKPWYYRIFLFFKNLIKFAIKMLTGKKKNVES